MQDVCLFYGTDCLGRAGHDKRLRRLGRRHSSAKTHFPDRLRPRPQRR